MLCCAHVNPGANASAANSANRKCRKRDETRTLQWDAAGHLTGDGVLIFEYDPRGQISKITNTTSGSIATYLSNALGQRVRKVVDGQVTDTVYGEELGMASYPLGNYQSGHAENTTEYIYLPTDQGPMPVAVQIGANLYAIDADHLNTPRRLTDQNGNPVWQWVITGFGELEPTTAETGFTRARLNTGTPAIAGTQAVEFNLRYPGQQYDAETGLYYNHHRYYDPYLTVGYTQADPLGLDGGWNRYGYVGGNPVNGIDPAGLWSVTFGIWDGAGWQLTVGINPNGSGFGSLQFGVGAGGGISWNPLGQQPGYKECQGASWGSGLGVYGEASANVGPIGAGIEANFGRNFRSNNGSENYGGLSLFGGLLNEIKGIKVAASAGGQVTLVGPGSAQGSCTCGR